MADDVTDKKKRVRSPNYPSINLEEALQKARIFYKEEDRHAANIEVAARHWGYKNAGAGGALIIAALTSFGLMEDEGTRAERRVKLTQIGLRLVLDGSPTKQKDLQVAALGPKIHAELWEKWGSSLPSVENMRFYLLSERGFNRGSVDAFIEEYRDTLTFAGLLNGGKISKSDKANDLLIGFDIGDYVRWESQGVLQFEARKVTAISDDLTHAFVEGSNKGLPVEQLAKVEPPTESEKGGVVTEGVLRTSSKIPPKPGMNQDIFTLPSGNAMLQWPATMTEAEYQFFEKWLDLMKMKMKLGVQANTEKPASAGEETK